MATRDSSQVGTERVAPLRERTYADVMPDPLAPSSVLRDGLESLRAELDRERALRQRAQATADRLATVIARENQLRLRAERQAEAAFAELKMVRTARDLTARSGMGRRMWQRARHTARR